MSQDSPTQSRIETGGAETTAPERWSLRVVWSPDTAKQQHTYALDAPLVVGRATDGLTVDDGRMSRAHARFAVKDGAIEITDCDSRNGVFVNGQRERIAAVRTPSIVRLGDSLFEVGPVGADKRITAHAALIGQSALFLQAVADAQSAAAQDLPVLLLGETGTGKEVFASCIHEWSKRKGAFVPLNMGALPESLIESELFGHVKGAFTGAHRDAAGAFQQADGGTLFLDEIGEMPLEMQPKLLRVLESHEFKRVGGFDVMRTNARIIAATNADLQREVVADTFRRDLFARLAGFVIRIPALRQRKSDIVLLARHFLSDVAFSTGFVEALLLHDWPMNVRELRNVMRRLAASGEAELRREQLMAVLQDISVPLSAPTETPTTVARRRPTRPELEAVLRQHAGNIVRTGLHYGRDAKQIYRWIEQLEIDLTAFR